MAATQTTIATTPAQTEATVQVHTHGLPAPDATVALVDATFPAFPYPDALPVPDDAGGTELTSDLAPAQATGRETNATEAFKVSRAVKYSTASLGAQSVFTMFNMAIPLYLESYGARPWLIGLLSNERSLVAAFVQPVVGRLSDRTRSGLGRRRPFFLVGIPLTCLCLLALGLHPSFWAMLALMTGAAVFMSIAMDPYLALMADVFPRGHRGRVGGFTGLACAAGTVIFLGLAALFWESREFAVFALVALLLGGCFAITFLTVKEPATAPPERWNVGTLERWNVTGQQTTDDGRQTARTAVVRRSPTFKRLDVPTFKPLHGVRAALSGLREFEQARKYTIALALYWGAGGGVAPFITLFAKHSLGAGSGATFLLPVGFVASSALLVLPAGYLADRIGKKHVMTVGLVLYSLGALFGSQATGIGEGMVAMAMLGAANACTTVMIALLTDLIPATRCGELVGVASAVWSLAQPAGAVLAGLAVSAAAEIVGLSDAYRLVFVLAGLVMGASALMLQRVRTTRPLE